MAFEKSAVAFCGPAHCGPHFFSSIKPNRIKGICVDDNRERIQKENIE